MRSIIRSKAFKSGNNPKEHDKNDLHIWCPRCRQAMVLREGSHGPFFGCTGYPKTCRKTLTLDEARLQIERRKQRKHNRTTGRKAKRKRKKKSLNMKKLAIEARRALGRPLDENYIREDLEEAIRKRETNNSEQTV